MAVVLLLVLKHRIVICLATAIKGSCINLYWNMEIKSANNFNALKQIIRIGESRKGRSKIVAI